MTCGPWYKQGPVEQLNQTEFTQPALLTASVALWRLWTQRPAALRISLAGHSLGEYSALGRQQCFIAQRWRARRPKKRPVNAGRRSLGAWGHGRSDGPARRRNISRLSSGDTRRRNPAVSSQPI